MKKPQATMKIEEILTQAHEAAVAAQAGMVEDFDCGFTWVNIPDARSFFVNQCRKISNAKLDSAANAAEYIAIERRYGSKHRGKGWLFWLPGTAPAARAQAFHMVLAQHGIVSRTAHDA